MYVLFTQTTEPGYKYQNNIHKDTEQESAKCPTYNRAFTGECPRWAGQSFLTDGARPAAPDPTAPVPGKGLFYPPPAEVAV